MVSGSGVRAITILGVAGALLTVSMSANTGVAAARARPNILFIMTDQQPLGGVGAYGNPIIRTPALDELASTGFVFDRFYITAFPCSPSRTSILSGRYAHHHGVVENDVLFDEKIPCLGDICRSAGYRTAYFGKWHLGGNMNRGREDMRAPGFNGKWFLRREPSDDKWRFEPVAGGFGEDQPQHGFDTWVGGWKHYHEYLREVGLGSLLEPVPRIGNHNDYPSGPEGRHIYSRLTEEQHMAAFLARQAERFVRNQRADAQPWCAVLSFYGPHLPVAPPKPWDTMYSLDQVKLPPNHRDTLEGKPAGQKNNRRCYVLPDWSDEQLKDYIRRYWGYCSYIDRQIGNVFAALRETSQWENTIVVFTTDHGDMVGAHGMIFKLGSCGYEELYHVPAMVRVPGLGKPGTRVGALASSIDLLPTVLEAAGISPPEEIDGRSLVPLLKGEAAQHRDEVFASYIDHHFICCDGRYKFVLHCLDRDVDELYDLRNDPGEMKNLISVPEHRSLAERMKRRVLTWLRETDHPYADTIARQATTKPWTSVPAGDSP